MPWKGRPFGWGVPKPYLDFLPEPEDASVKVLREIEEHLAANALGETLKVTVSLLEPPSIELASELMFRAYNSDIRMERSIGAIPKPDPRKSKAKFKLWNYSSKTATPAVPRPDPQLIEFCQNLALETYDYRQNWQQSKVIADQLAIEQAQQVLAVMVHPPRVQNAIKAWVWVQRVQLAAAQIVAHLEITHDIGLPDSRLVEILHGPIDWTIDASIIALTQRANDQPQFRAELGDLLFRFLDRIPNQGHWSPYSTALQNLLLIPDLPTELEHNVVAKLHDLQMA